MILIDPPKKDTQNPLLQNIFSTSTRHFRGLTTASSNNFIPWRSIAGEQLDANEFQCPALLEFLFLLFKVILKILKFGNLRNVWFCPNIVVTKNHAKHHAIPWFWRKQWKTPGKANAQYPPEDSQTWWHGYYAKICKTPWKTQHL